MTEPTLIKRIDRTGLPLLVARAILGYLFVQMGWEKIGDPVGFLKLVRMYEMLPDQPAIFLNATAIILPWLEVVCGAALLLGVFVRGSSAVVAIMLAVFTPVIFFRAMNIVAVDNIPFMEVAFDCGCGGGPVIIWKKLLSNSGLFALAIIATLSGSRLLCLSRVIRPRRSSQKNNAPSDASAESQQMAGDATAS